MTNQTWVLRVLVSAFTFVLICGRRRWKSRKSRRRYLDVQRDDVDGNTDALVGNATRGSTPTVVVFQNVLHESCARGGIGMDHWVR